MSKIKVLEIVDTKPAVDVAKRIAQLHSEICQSVRSTLDKAIEIGELLSDTKASLKHGEWLPWLRLNAPFTAKTAQNYLRLFENRERLKCETVSDLTQAYRPETHSDQPDKRPPPWKTSPWNKAEKFAEQFEFWLIRNVPRKWRGEAAKIVTAKLHNLDLSSGSVVS